MSNFLTRWLTRLPHPPPALPNVDVKTPMPQVPPRSNQEQAMIITLPGGFTGEKFYGGMPRYITSDLDYVTLREYSRWMASVNLYAKAAFGRLCTHVVNTGLVLEATPISRLLGQVDFADWQDEVEGRFHVWANDPKLCDYYKKDTFYQIQLKCFVESLIAGDCLVILRFGESGLPNIQLVMAEDVVTPMMEAGTAGRDIRDGVERNDSGVITAYWVRERDDRIGGSTKATRVPVVGENSGVTQAVLVVGYPEKSIGQLRGAPLLSAAIQSLYGIDDYRDAEIRAAQINGALCLYLLRENKAGLPTPMGAVRKTVVEEETDSSGTKRPVNVIENLPGTIIDNLGAGESIQSHDTTRPNINFKAFEDAVISTIAMAIEIPPEEFKLIYGGSYSGARAAGTGLDLAVGKLRKNLAVQLCAPAYQFWHLCKAIRGEELIPNFMGLYRDSTLREAFQAWLQADWAGVVRPHIDPVKEVKALALAINEGLISREEATRALNGGNWERNIKRLERENRLLAAANKILAQKNVDNGEDNADNDDKGEKDDK